MLSKYFIAPREKKKAIQYTLHDMYQLSTVKTVEAEKQSIWIQIQRPFKSYDYLTDIRITLSRDFFLESFDLIADQLRSTYEMTLSRSWMNETVQSEKVIKSVPELLQLNVYVFHYIILRGIYRIEFRLCDIDTDDLDYGCDQKTISSGKVPVMTSLPGLESSWCLQV